MESELRNEKEREADARHEKSWNKCNPVVLFLTNQIDSDGPKVLLFIGLTKYFKENIQFMICFWSVSIRFAIKRCHNS
jgi:hypothetical protein